MERGCSNCAHWDCDVECYPCDGCKRGVGPIGASDLWEPRDTVPVNAELRAAADKVKRQLDEAKATSAFAQAELARELAVALDCFVKVRGRTGEKFPHELIAALDKARAAGLLDEVK